MFGSKKKPSVDETETLAYQIAQLKGDLQAVSEELAEARNASAARAETEKYRREIADMRIEKSRIEEEHARKMRDVEHKVGLEKLRQETEVRNAKREAELSVREEHLTNQQKTFENNMKFQREQMQAHTDRFESVFQQVVERLPIVSIGSNVPVNEDDATVSSRPAKKPTAKAG